jgi:regulator of nucleoside diphosphate kinase
MSKPSKPDIYVNQDDHEELIDLALRALGRVSGAALLLQEMERATVAETSPPNAVAMNSNVDFEYSGRRYRDFKVVYPQCADITDGRISVLTPVGAALIGLTEGATMTWVGLDRDVHSLTVLKVGVAPHH